MLYVAESPDRFEIDGRRNAIQVTVLAAPSQPQPVEDQPTRIEVPPVEQPAEVTPEPPVSEFSREMDMRPTAPPRADDLAPSARRSELARSVNPPAPERSNAETQTQGSQQDASEVVALAPAKRAVQPPREPVLEQSKPLARRRQRRSAVTLAAQPTVEVPQIAGVNDKTPPDFAGNASPAYPPEAVRRRLEGTVLLELEVSMTGQVQNVNILRSSGHSILDQSAVRTVRNWRGRPARQADRAVATVESIPIRFRLGD